MTEQTKIPVPSEDAPAGGGGSLIERAARAFDLSSLAPPPVPRDLAPPSKPAVRNHPPETRAEPAPAAPPLAEIAPPPPRPANEAASPPPVAPPAVEVVPSSVAASPVVAVAPPQPVKFGGPRHAISREHLREHGLIVPEGAVTKLLEEFRIVKRQVLAQAQELRRQGSGAAAQRVLICSPHPGEGKTYCATNLALAIAGEKESEVLLVDADFAKPSILSALGLPGGPGLMDALSDPTVDVMDCAIGTDIAGLWVLPAGNATTSDSEYLSSSRSRAVLDRLTEGAPQRIVIFDSPPALAASPAAELASYVGQALVVARADLTGQGALEDAISLLSGCPNIQLLLNAVSFSPSGRRFGSYYGYGE